MFRSSWTKPPNRPGALASNDMQPSAATQSQTRGRRASCLDSEARAVDIARVRSAIVRSRLAPNPAIAGLSLERRSEHYTDAFTLHVGAEGLGSGCLLLNA